MDASDAETGQRCGTYPAARGFNLASAKRQRHAHIQSKSDSLLTDGGLFQGQADRISVVSPLVARPG
jgi:hypothetical protein